jgi:hypothetical protein
MYFQQDKSLNIMMEEKWSGVWGRRSGGVVREELSWFLGVV